MNNVRLKNLLREKGIQPSLHRIKILEYLMNTKEHPTADTIYQHLSDYIPTLSKTTVYNTLSVFKEKGLVAELTIDENEVRFDFNTSPHVHFECVKCGRVYDVDMKFEPLNGKIVDGHQVMEHHIYLKGVCKNCLNDSNS